MNYYYKIKWKIIMIFIFGISFSSMFLLGLNTNYGVQAFKDINNISQKLDQNFDDVSSEQFSYLSSGSQFSGVIFNDEEGTDHLYMWGDNKYSQLGISNLTRYSNVPIEIDPDGTLNSDGTPDGIQGTITNLSLGDSHSGVVINDDEGIDHLYMWGRNEEGQVGNGTTGGGSPIVEIDPDGTKNKDGTPDGIQGTITNLSLGSNHSGVVIKDEEGTDHLYMWGRNNYGQLGVETNGEYSNVPIDVDGGEDDVIQGTITNLFLGEDYSGVVINDDEGIDHLYMWGYNEYGQLGNNSTTDSIVPIEIDPDGTSNSDGTPDGIQGTITNLSLGVRHSGVVIKDEEGTDHLYMWGDNFYGQLGNNSTTDSIIPIEIDPDGTSNSDGTPDGIQGTITNLSVESFALSSIVIEDKLGIDHLYMWGYNNYGQLGNNSTTNSIVPIEIDPDGTSNSDGTPDGIQGTVTDLALGFYYSGVVINDDEEVDHLYMWGWNSKGQLGNGENVWDGNNVPNEITPSLIIGETTIASPTEDGKTVVTINWDGEQNSANSIDKLELIGTDVKGDGDYASVDLLNGDNSNFENGSYSINLEYGTYDDWQINYSTNFGYGTVNIKPFKLIEKITGEIDNISILDINYIDENNVNATFNFKSSFEGTTEIKDNEITISGDNFTDQIVTVDKISKDDNNDGSFSIDLDYGTEYDLTANYTLVTDTDSVGEMKTYNILSFETVEHVTAPTINSVSIDEESMTETTAILDYSIYIPKGDKISTQNTIITKIEVKDKNETLYGSIDNYSGKKISSDGKIELSGLTLGQSYNDLYIVVYAEGDVAGDEVIVNADDSIEEGHIGGFKLSISIIILYSALLIFAIGSIIGLIIGLTWYFIRRKKSLIM